MDIKIDIKPLMFELTRFNDKYFPGKYGARKEVEINLKEFILQKNFIKRKNNNLSNTSSKLIKIKSNKLLKIK